MTREDRLLTALASGRRLCDDCLSDIVNIKPRQSVYQACTALRKKGLITRMTESCQACNRMKITNARIPRTGSVSPSLANAERVPSNPASSDPPPVQGAAAKPTAAKPWHWEGNVQRQIVCYLQGCNARIVAEANTATRGQGKDIEAIDADGSTLWVTVKGFPESSPNTQARHWFAGALLDLCLYRNQSSTARLALGLPRGFSTYEGLVKRTAATLGFLHCHVFWVAADGTVSRESITEKTPKWAD